MEMYMHMASSMDIFPLTTTFFLIFDVFFCHIEKHRNSHRSNLIFF